MGIVGLRSSLGSVWGQFLLLVCLVPLWLCRGDSARPIVFAIASRVRLMQQQTLARSIDAGSLVDILAEACQLYTIVVAERSAHKLRSILLRILSRVF